MKSTTTVTPVSVPLRERKWVDVNPGSYDHECYVISKAMIRLLRHDPNILMEIDGAVKFEDIVEDFNKRKNFAMVTQRLDFYSGKKDGASRKGFNIV